MEMVLVLVARDTRAMGEKVSEFYLLSSPTVRRTFDGPQAVVTKGCTFAWAASLPVLARKVPKGARIISEGEYCAPHDTRKKD